MRIGRYYAPEKVSSKDKNRPQLAHPYLDVDAGKVVATNGHSLVAVPVDVDGHDVSGYLAGELLKIARRTCGKDVVEAEIRDRTRIVPHDIEWPCNTTTGCTFPDWRKVLPSFKPGDPGTVTVGVDARLLRQIADALGGEGGVTMTFRLDSVNADKGVSDEGVVLEPQIIVRSRFGRDGEVGVLMPLRLDPSDLRYIPPALPDDASDDDRKAALDAEADVFLRGNGSLDLTKGPK